MERIIELSYNLKKKLGKWYTVFFQRILPFLIYILPINIVMARFSDWFFARILGEAQDLLSSIRSPYFLVMWCVLLLVFFNLLLFAPRAATVAEFLFGIAYIAVAIRFNYFNPFGIALFAVVSVFLLFKVLFLIVNIMYDYTYGDDDVERGESGRRVRKSDSDYFFG